MAATTAAASRITATTTTKPTRGGVKKYSSEEIFAWFERIRRILPTGNEQWELVADLHSVHFTTGETTVPDAVNTSVPGRRSSNVSVVSSNNQSTAAAASLKNKKPEAI